VIHKAATDRANHKQSSKDRAQAASEGAIHGTSNRTESYDALGRVVAQRATNSNDREECSKLLCLRLGETMHAYWWRKYTIESCIPTYFHWLLDKTNFTNQNIKFLCPMMIGLVRHGYPWVPTDQAHGRPRQVGPYCQKTHQPVNGPNRPSWRPTRPPEDLPEDSRWPYPERPQDLTCKTRHSVDSDQENRRIWQVL
jgi:hypothetical protein